MVKTLYKYRNYSDTTKFRTLEIISRQQLFFSGIEAFNDPFDGRVHLRHGGKLTEIKAAQVRVQYSMQLQKEEKFEGITMNQAIDLIDDKITQEIIESSDTGLKKLDRVQELHNKKGVLSLSSKNDNILMWSHYSNNHYGVCFGFEFDEGIYNSSKRVRYQTHYEDIWSWLHTDDEIVNKILLTKSIDWQYEDEYRIIRNQIGVESFNPNTLTEIIFGCKMKQSDKIEIMLHCEKHGLRPKFKEAKLDVESYKLNIIDYETK